MLQPVRYGFSIPAPRLLRSPFVFPHTHVICRRRHIAGCRHKLATQNTPRTVRPAPTEVEEARQRQQRLRISKIDHLQPLGLNTQFSSQPISSLPTCPLLTDRFDPKKILLLASIFFHIQPSANTSRAIQQYLRQSLGY